MPSAEGKIEVRTPYDLFPVDLLDQRLCRIDRRYGSFETRVRPGLYLVRCEAGGPTAERLMKVAAGQTVSVTFSREDVYLMPSAAPVPGSASWREFYTDRMWHLAYGQPQIVLGSGARLVVFATRPDFGMRPDWQTGAPPVNWDGIRLLDRSGRLCCALPGDDGRDEADRRVGRAGLSVDLEPGGYFMEWTVAGGDGRSALQAVWLSSGWITFVFAAAFGSSATPRRDCVSIHMAKMDQHAMHDDRESAPVNGAAELALASLRTGRRQLQDSRLRTLMQAEFENPMLGLLGAHMLLQRSDPDRELFWEICIRLRGLLGAHPDIDALELAGAERFGPPRSIHSPKIAYFPTASAFPPMLREGLAALERARWHRTGGPVLSGATRLAWLRRLPEGPWTTFWHDTSSVPSHEDSPFAAAEREATQDASDELLSYLWQLYKTRGLAALRSLTPAHLYWAGLSPEETRIAHLAVVKKATHPEEQLDVREAQMLQALRAAREQQAVLEAREAQMRQALRAANEKQEAARERLRRIVRRAGVAVAAMTILAFSAVYIGYIAHQREQVALSGEQIARNDERMQQHDLLAAYSQLGDLLRLQGKLPEALDAYQQGLTISKGVAGQDKSNAGWQGALSTGYGQVGSILEAQGKLPEALEAYRQDLAISKRLAEQDPSNLGWQRDLSVSYDKVGDVQRAQGDLAGALQSYRDGLAIAGKLARQDPANAARPGGAVRAEVVPKSKSEARVMAEKARDILRQLKARPGLTDDQQRWLDSIEADLRNM